MVVDNWKSVDGYCSVYIPHCTLMQEHKLLSILFNPIAPKNDRLYFVGFLKSIGLSFDVVMDIIKKLNRWDNYNNVITESQVKSIYKIKLINQKTKTKKIFNVYDIMEEFIIKRNKEPIFFMGNKETNKVFPIFSEEDFVNKAAAEQYLEIGFVPLPKSKDGKYPSIKWRKYADIKPTFDEISKMDFSDGVCLIATKETCFLDIDKKGMEDQKIKSMVIELCKTSHYETTPNHGIHIFAKGNVEMDKTFKGIVEIIGYGGLIVAAPTKGYVSNGAFL